MKNPQGGITLFLQTQAKGGIALFVYKSIAKRRRRLSRDTPPPPTSTFILHIFRLTYNFKMYFKKEIQH